MSTFNGAFEYTHTQKPLFFHFSYNKKKSERKKKKERRRMLGRKFSKNVKLKKKIAIFYHVTLFSHACFSFFCFFSFLNITKTNEQEKKDTYISNRERQKELVTGKELVQKERERKRGRNNTPIKKIYLAMCSPWWQEKKLLIGNVKSICSTVIRLVSLSIFL